MQLYNELNFQRGMRYVPIIDPGISAGNEGNVFIFKTVWFKIKFLIVSICGISLKPQRVITNPTWKD